MFLASFDEESSSQPPSKMQKIQIAEVRRFSSNYLKLGFVTVPNDSSCPMYLVRDSVLSNETMKPFRLKDHFKRNHPHKLAAIFKSFETKMLSKAPFEHFLPRLTCSRTMVLLSDVKSLCLFRKRQSHFVLAKILCYQLLKKLLLRLCSKSASSVLCAMPLSNDTVKRRVDNIGFDSRGLRILGDCDNI